MLHTQWPRVPIPAVSKNFSDEILQLLKLIDGIFRNSGQRLDNVDITHLVASGRLASTAKKFC